MTRMLQDILAEPDELLRCLDYTLGEGYDTLEQAVDLIASGGELIITGIGGSWHAGMALLSLFRRVGAPATLVDASELLHFGEVPDDATVLVLSRSGKSIEVVRLLENMTEGASLVSITNTPDSPLAQASDVTLNLNAAFDHNVSITMYSALTLVGGILACGVMDEMTEDLTRDIERSLNETRDRMDTWQKKIEASDWFAADPRSPTAGAGSLPTYFLGRGGSVATAHAGRLLWEEAAKTSATALTTGGFRHGPQEVLKEGTRIGLWFDGEILREEDLLLTAELRKHGAKVMAVGQNLPDDAADLVLSLPDIPAPMQFVTDVIPVQLAAERLARLRGVDPDTFRICSYIVESETGL